MVEKENIEDSSGNEICETCGKRRKLVEVDADQDLLDKVRICQRCGKAYAEENDQSDDTGGT